MILKCVWIVLILIIIFSITNKSTDFFHDKKNKNIVFFHICSLRNWKEIFLEQLELMKKSGLYDDIESLNIGFLGDKKDIIPFLNDKIRLVYHSTNLKEYEKPTINKLLEFSKKRKNHIMYYIYILKELVEINGKKNISKIGG